MTVRFGIVGTAFWAREVHVPGLRRTAGAAPVALWGRNVDEARAIAATHDLEAFADFDAMLDAVDALSFAVPPDVQASLALRAARAGKHLLLEKPIARSSAAADAIADEVGARNLCSVVFFMRRFVPEIEAAIVGASNGRRWTSASVRVYSAALADNSPYASSVWRREPGASLWDLGPHVLSILIPVLGEVREVSAEPLTDTYSRFVTVHEGGARASVSLTLNAPGNVPLNDYRFESPAATVTLPDPSLDRPGVYATAASELVANIARSAPAHRCDARFGAGIVRTLEALASSRATGTTIALR
jgi:predicted dehydrogenase